VSLERLQKILAQAGLASRRQAEALILAGRVQVNGQVSQSLGARADPELDRIELDGQLIQAREKLGYYMFHKPAGYLTSLADPQNRPTVKVFLKKLPIRVYPIGRLDYDVSGLLILTNDGELARRLMHPSFEVPKLYRAQVRGVLTPERLKRLSSGQILIEGKPAAPARARLLTSGPDRGWLELVLTEGRHRQVKRMCAAVGTPVEVLKRLGYGGLRLDPNLQPGDIRPLKGQEILTLKAQAQLT
jgi:23S rRNA pseudouridine2605 synthase